MEAFEPGEVPAPPLPQGNMRSDKSSSPQHPNTLNLHATMSLPSLIAHYSSSQTTQIFTSELPPLPEDGSSVEQKTCYLAALRAKTTKLQDEVNGYLTQKMDDDKVAEGQKGKASKDTEEREEEMYGEEDPEEAG